MDIRLVDLKTGRNPDAEDADVDGQQDEEAQPLESSRIRTDNHEEANSVDDDLDEALHLRRPCDN